MRFMLCLDGSDYSRAAVDECRKLAHEAHAQVLIVRVVKHDVPNLGEPWSGNIDMPGYIEEEFKAQDREMQDELTAVANTFEPPAEVALLHGAKVSDVIVREAEHREVDLIVMATHSRGLLGEAFFGSTAADVTHSGVAPVLMVHPIESPSLEGVPQGISVFTHDGQEAGTVRLAVGKRLEVTNPRGRDFWLSARDVDGVEGGRLLLKIDSIELHDHAYIEPAKVH